MILIFSCRLLRGSLVIKFESFCVRGWLGGGGGVAKSKSIYIYCFACYNLSITTEAPSFSDEGDGRIFYSYYLFHVSFIARDFLSYFSPLPVIKLVVCVGETLF